MLVPLFELLQLSFGFSELLLGGEVVVGELFLDRSKVHDRPIDLHLGVRRLGFRLLTVLVGDDFLQILKAFAEFLDFSQVLLDLTLELPRLRLRGIGLFRSFGELDLPLHGLIVALGLLQVDNQVNALRLEP